MSYVDPQGPDGWIKDPCPYCGAKSGKKCRSKYGTGPEIKEPHRSREDAWSARRAKEVSS